MHSPEFKAEAIKLAERNTVAKVARQLFIALHRFTIVAKL
jgi:transposase-like protein